MSQTLLKVGWQAKRCATYPKALDDHPVTQERDHGGGVALKGVAGGDTIRGADEVGATIDGQLKAWTSGGRRQHSFERVLVSTLDVRGARHGGPAGSLEALELGSTGQGRADVSVCQQLNKDSHPRLLGGGLGRVLVAFRDETLEAVAHLGRPDSARKVDV